MADRPLVNAQSPLVGARLADMLAELINRPAWQADALCREYPDIDFFSTRAMDVAAAKAICARCLVQVECLDATRARTEYGVWGGVGEDERPSVLAAAHGARIDGETDRVYAALVAVGGTVNCERGMAASKLREVVGDDIQPGAFHSRLRRLEIEGRITRIVRPTKTYSISVVPEGAS